MWACATLSGKLEKYTAKKGGGSDLPYDTDGLSSQVEEMILSVDTFTTTAKYQG